jgi:tricarballylate dehydrogenase
VQSRDIQIRYGTSLESIIKEDGRVTGAVFQREGSPLTLHCDALILACGSFEASSDMRKSSMGAEWAAMKVRGTRFNTGKGLIAALAVGAQPHGNWAGGHGVPVDAASKEFGELALGETTRRCLFQYGITVDENGKRFMDEGQDRKTFMYGITGVEVARQPGARAFQIFDAKIMTANFEKLFYFSSGYLVAQTLDELALMMGVPKAAFIDEVGAYRHRHQQAL